ncbi:hypothetical protein BPO_0746 [Bergeyella porcorum]|uniref:Biogenesis of lysosome-related organelles complex 1 subunit 7 n=2 Tax=Bergeyella porcorum TaxID=1735111 RepID=A0AAU0EYP3_9FLAO
MSSGFMATTTTQSPALSNKFKNKTTEVFYASELLSQISTFPKFQNSDLNQEVSLLKNNISEYVYAVQNHNLIRQEEYLYRIEKSYKKIQSIRKTLSPKDDEIINRHLVRIKSNLYQLQSIKRDSLK